MERNLLKTIITVMVLFILVGAAIKFVIHVFLPLAVIVIAAYVVYMFFSGRRR